MGVSKDLSNSLIFSKALIYFSKAARIFTELSNSIPIIAQFLLQNYTK
jgi:hypothetical protein